MNINYLTMNLFQDIVRDAYCDMTFQELASRTRLSKRISIPSRCISSRNNNSFSIGGMLLKIVSVFLLESVGSVSIRIA